MIFHARKINENNFGSHIECLTNGGHRNFHFFLVSVDNKFSNGNSYIHINYILANSICIYKIEDKFEKRRCFLHIQ